MLIYKSNKIGNTLKKLKEIKIKNEKNWLYNQKIVYNNNY